jgi:6-phosphogluconate dehydrogenase
MKKELGFVGLGRMGLNMALHLREQDFRVVGIDRNAATGGIAAEAGIEFVSGLAEMVAVLPFPRIIWLMVPSSAVDTVMDELTPLLSPGDTVVDGGNSFYKDSLRRHQLLSLKGIHFLDCGTSGGMEGARHGAAIMVGGEHEIYSQNEMLFAALATKDGYARVGNAGAGHFVKMVHNGIEYGMMGAIAEGMDVLHRHDEEFGIVLPEVLKPYEHESIISSKLVSWLSRAYAEGQVEAIKGEVPEGETESEMEHILTLGNTKVLAAALLQRKETREQESYIGKLIAAMRNQFGGHRVISKN